MRVDRGRGDRLAGGVDHRDLHAGTETRVQAHGGPGAGWRGEQQVTHVGGEHRDRLVLGPLPQPHPQVDAEMDQDAGPPGPADRLGEPAVTGPAPVGDAGVPGDLLLIVAEVTGRGGALLRVRLARVQGEVKDLLLLPAEHRQDPVRGERAQRLVELEVVGELGARLLPALPHPRDQAAPRPHPLAQHADQVSVLAEPLGQDRPRTVEGGGHVRHPAPGIDVGLRAHPRVTPRVGQQLIGQRLQASFPGDLRFGAPFRLVGEVDVLQPGLGVGRHDLRREGVVQLALRADRLQDRVPPFGEFTQVPEPLFQGPELGVVQRAGRLLAVAGDERHRGAAVEQRDGGCHLGFAHTEFLGDLAVNRDRDGHGHDREPPSRQATGPGPLAQTRECTVPSRM